MLSQAERLAARGSREAAAPCYRRALAILRPSDLARRIDARTGLARLDEGRGAFEAAHARLTRALSEAEAYSGPDAERTADVLHQLGWVEYRLGRFAEAIRDLRRAQSIYERVLGLHHSKVTQILNKLGAVFREQGEYERAESILKQALADLDRYGEGDGSLRAAIYNNLAGVAYYRNDYRRAIELYRSAAGLFEDFYGETHIEVARTANNLGLLYFEVGDYDQARQQLERALCLKTALLGPEHATVGSTLSNLGQLEAANGDNARALSYFGRAEQILSRAVGRNHPQVATVLLNWAVTLAERGDRAGARPLLERALAIREKAFGADSYHVAETLNALGPVWSALGEGRKAVAATRRALAIAAAGEERELVWNAYHAYAQILARAGHLPGAAFYGKYAVNVLQTMRADLALLGKHLPALFLLRRESAYRQLADRLINLGRLTEAEQVMTMLKEEEFFGFTGLASTLGAGDSARAEFSTDETPGADRLDAATLAVRTSAQRLHAASATPSVNAPRAAQNRRDRTKFDAAVRSVDNELTHATPRFATFRPSLRANAPIAARTAVLSYLVTPDHVQLIVQTAGAHESHALAVNAAALNRMVFDFRQALQNPGANPLPLGRELHRVLILPVQTRLASDHVESLELMLDGALHYLPFSALHDGGGFLVERYRIGLKTSLELARDAGVTDRERLAAFGVTHSVGGFPALPRVRDELDSIVRSGRPESRGFVPGVVVLDEEFTAERLSRELDERYALVHIATHFVVRHGRLSESYLLLGDGSRLTLERIKSDVLSFRDVRLLTLSACSTAVGEPNGTGAEFESFSVLAGRLGAHEVLATLWPVADNGTSVLMASVYRLRQEGRGTVAAVTEAQRAMLTAGGRHGPYAHPYYWAPFVVFLNDRPS